MKIKGVNLGNWLVLEKWMSPALFKGTTAEDEYNLPLQLPREVYEARIQVHRSEYVTERDFAIIRGIGLNAVRIPVPYFIFGDRAPFLGCIEELDHAVAWAEKYGLQVLVDLHTVPYSQNGFDNGGLSGVCRWSQMPEEVDYVLGVLEKLAERYAEREGLLGIEILNEPVTETIWTYGKIQERYPAADPEMAKGSAPNSLEFLRDFYTKAYRKIRKHLPEEKCVVIHDAFMLKSWKDFMREDEFKNVILDTHMYLMNAEAMGCEQNVGAYLTFIKDIFAKDIAEMQEYFPTICGEWCLFNSYACGIDTKGGQTVFNGIQTADEEYLGENEKRLVYRELADAQMKAWEQGAGYFYWNYKLLLDTVNENGWIGWDSWDLGKCHSLGWFPTVEKV